jgi:hypothetical protein
MRRAYEVYLRLMIANPTNFAERFVTPPGPMLERRWKVAQFTRADAEALVRLGIIPEDASTELLSGVIVLKDRAACGQDSTMIGNDHTKVVERLSDLRVQINSGMRHVRSQQPIECSEIHIPEPDFMVLPGTLDDYSDLPTAADAWCVVEVADASYERDASEKLRGYAWAGVGQYVIINLRNRTAEVYTEPDRAAGTYRVRRTIAAGESLALRVGDGDFFALPLSDILP